MKKIILVASVFLSQMSMASSPAKVNECFGKVKDFSDRLLEVATPVASSEGVLVGTTSNGEACQVSVTQRTSGTWGGVEAHEEIYVSVKSASGIVSFNIENYHDSTISGATGTRLSLPDKKVDFNVGQCRVDSENLLAKVSFSQLYVMKKLSVSNLGNGILQFKVKEDGDGLLGLGELLTIGLKNDCTVDLNSQR
ncbi:hypothetical protein [Bdellovibrio bacteriovorus]|uniref:hypothetical protein n=1 Tax=Bdellovibrio bacteriovorus TaxID=959 RepID=UPI0005A0FB69|nr:hypothetical protein [Bdellovibrio bacteriovorus]